MAEAKHAETTLRASSPVNPATLMWHIRSSSPSDPGEDDPDERGDRDLRARSSPTSTGLPSKDRSTDDDDEPNEPRSRSGLTTLRSLRSTPNMARAVIGTYPQMSTATTAASAVNA